MIKNLVPKEITLQLIEIGFNEDCYAAVYANGNILIHETPVKNSESKRGACIFLPMYSDVIDWLYKQYGYWIVIEDFNHPDLATVNRDGFMYYITEYTSCVVGIEEMGLFRSYTDVLQSAIIKIIELIKEQ